MATSDKTIGLVIPTRWEASEVLRRFGFRRARHGLWRADVDGTLVYVSISGVGRQAAAKAADKLVAEGAGELVSMGFCGALSPKLNVGDVVTDRIITVDKPVRTPQERRDLTQKANAVAVDMETQAVIEAGTRRGVPIHILRVVSDHFSDDLTPLFGQNGSFSGWTIALRLLNPKAWPLAQRLKRQSAIAKKVLADALDTFLQKRS